LELLMGCEGGFANPWLARRDVHAASRSILSAESNRKISMQLAGAIDRVQAALHSCACR